MAIGEPVSYCNWRFVPCRHLSGPIDLFRAHEQKAPSNILCEFEHSSVESLQFCVTNVDFSEYFLALHPIGPLRAVNDGFQASSSERRVPVAGRVRRGMTGPRRVQQLFTI